MNIKTEILSGLARTLNLNLLKYSVGRAISCSACGSILDYRRAALVSIAFESPDGEPESLGSFVLCSACLPEKQYQVSALSALSKAQAALVQVRNLSEADCSSGLRLEILDKKAERAYTL